MDESAAKLFGMRVAHVGINAACAEEADQWADQFTALMGFAKKEKTKSVFAEDLVEIMKENGRGEKGHIGFAVKDCEAALRYFEARGMHVIENTKKFDDEGNCVFAYFEEQIGGFAIHLIQTL